MPSAFFCRLMASTAVLAWTIVPFGSFAQSPQSPAVVSGSIAVNRQGATTVVTQSTDKGVIDWRSFSIGPREAVRFDQPGRSSVTLNRVTSSEISRIDGSLSATGQVWLANPNGVMIGPGGQINVGGLLATTGRIDTQQFLKSGRADIDQISKDAAIVNSGAITIGAGGYAALAASAIRNEGVIVARAGTIAMGAGKAATVDFVGDKLISFQLTHPLDQTPANAEALLVNTGVISAKGGTVLMSARAAKGVMDNVVNLAGHVIANIVRVDGGTVIFGDGGAALVSAKIDASNAEGTGGSVAVRGEKVGLMDSAVIDASGSTGGGSVSVGGEWQGKGQTGANGQNATATYVAPTASINVDATKVGEGGVTVIWSDGVTRFHGTISARGGIAGGDGGKVETSGKGALQVGPTASVITANRAPAAKPGSWLLDPADITIRAGGAETLAGGLFAPMATSAIDPVTISAGLATGDVTLQTSAGSGGAGDIVFVSGAISYSGTAGRSLTLAADRNVTMGPGTAIISNAGSLNVTMLASATSTTQNAVQGGISIQGATIATMGGSLLLAAGVNGVFEASGGASLGGVGVSISHNSFFSLGDSAVTIRGRGRLDHSLSVDNPHGVWIDSSGIFADGAVTLRGVGGDNPNVAAHGVFIDNSNIVSASSLSIDGVGGTGGGGIGGGDRRGVVVANSRITSGAGSNVVSGASGAGADRSAGVHLVNSGISTQSDLTLTTPQGSRADVVLEAGSLFYGATGSGNLSILSDANVILSAGSKINSGSGSGRVRLNASAYATTQSDVTGGILVRDTSILAFNNNLDLVAGQSGTLFAIGNSAIGGGGVQIANSGIVLGSGALTALGRGGDTLSINTVPGLSIEQTTIFPQGGVTVAANGVVIDLANITAAGGVTLIGKGGGNATQQARGVDMQRSTVSVGSGTVSIEGTGGATALDSKGVYLSETVLSSTTGPVKVTGISGAAGTAYRNFGIHMRASALTFGGDATFTTPSGAGSDVAFEASSISFVGATPQTLTVASHANVFMYDRSAISASAGAPLNIVFKASADALTQSEVSGGVHINTGTILTNGGNLDLVAGKSGELLAVGNALVQGRGVQIWGNSTINLGSGALKALGGGRSGAGDNYTQGVEIDHSVVISNGGLTLIGQGGDGALIEGHGVIVKDSIVTVSSGDITIKGVGGGGAAEARGVSLWNASITQGTGKTSISGVAGATSTAPIRAGIYIDGASLSSFGHVTLTGEGPTGIAISGAPLPGGGPEITAAALSISTQGTGNKINATVSGSSGAAAAAAVDLRSGTIRVNGVMIPVAPTITNVVTPPTVNNPTIVTQTPIAPPVIFPVFPPPTISPTVNNPTIVTQTPIAPPVIFPVFPPPVVFPLPVAPPPLFFSLISNPIFINSVLAQIMMPATNFGFAPPPIPFFLPPPALGFNPAFFAPPGAIMNTIFPGLLYIASYPPPTEP